MALHLPAHRCGLVRWLVVHNRAVWTDSRPFDCLEFDTMYNTALDFWPRDNGREWQQQWKTSRRGETNYASDEMYNAPTGAETDPNLRDGLSSFPPLFSTYDGRD
jgi:hypothetical protein